MSGGIFSRLARSAGEHFIATGEAYPMPQFLAPELQRASACFISIYENPGRYLRAHFGQATPRYHTIAEEIIFNVTQALRTARGRKLTKADMVALQYIVAVLGPLERINGAVHLDPNFYGLYIRSDRNKTGLVLPRRLGIETGEEQIATALRESGIDSRSEAVSFYRFQVEYFE